MIDPGVTGYNDLAMLPDHTFLCLYERGSTNGSQTAHAALPQEFASRALGEAQAGGAAAMQQVGVPDLRDQRETGLHGSGGELGRH